MSAGFAQDNTACFECHADLDISTERDGKTVSLTVDAAAFAAAVHGSLECVACHADLEGKTDFPHDAPLAKVECGTCHADEQAQFDESLHGRALARGDKLAPRCASCHGNHAIRAVKDPQSDVAPIRVPFVCGKCHQEGAPVQRERTIHQDHILENFTESIHGEGLLKKGLAVAATCASCHSAHHILPHTDTRSTIARVNIAATCTKCHAQIEQVHRKIIKGELWQKEAHVLPACVDCHQPHKARKIFYEQGSANRDCLRCHARADIRAAAGGGRSLSVDIQELAGSRHANVACSQCHSEVQPSRTRPCSTITHKVDCGSCHAEVAAQYHASRHGRLLDAGDPNAPTCKECHGQHGVLGRKDPKSQTFPLNVPDLCARCHQEGRKAAVRYTGEQHEIVKHYEESIHGKGLLKSGLVVTAMCADCHTAHSIQPASDTASSVHPDHIPGTCGRCHHGIEEKFQHSVHSPNVTKTDKPLPVCSDCHTAHTIRRADEEGFRVSIIQTCGRCHEEIAKSYFETFHGKVSQLGYGKTAKCFDCHGAHDIHPVDDPRSHLSRQNVVATCQKCHEGATRRFAGYLTHATHHDPKKYPWLFWTFWGMTALLVGTFAVSGLHTLLWLPRALQMRKVLLEIRHDPLAKQVVRFTRLNRGLHIAMIVSFLSLALTGLTLKFSYTRWAVILSRLFGGFETAGNIHRGAAILMFCVFVTHLVDLLRRKRNEFGSWRAMLFGPDTMMPTWKDAREVVGTIKWFVGMGERPQYGRWTYWEKFDYFAVFWGITIIGSTGLMLWFSEFFTRFLPGWFLNVATIIHSDEALLAVGFIFTVHFFNTHLRPEKFPMDMVIFTGRVPLEEFKRDRPAEYEALAASGRLERYLADPYPPVVVRAFRIFGWTALTIGFSVVIWIIYAMLFAYR